MLPWLPPLEKRASSTLIRSRSKTVMSVFQINSFSSWESVESGNVGGAEIWSVLQQDSLVAQSFSQHRQILISVTISEVLRGRTHASP